MIITTNTSRTAPVGTQIAAMNEAVAELPVVLRVAFDAVEQC